MAKDKLTEEDFKVVIRQALFSPNTRKAKYENRKPTQEELNKKWKIERAKINGDLSI